MGLLGAVIRAGCAVAFVNVATVAHAGVVTIESGTSGTDGYTQVEPDDFGCYGRLISQSNDDDFDAPGMTQDFGPTYLTGVMLFVTTPGDVKSSVLLAGTKFWHDFVEGPPQPDGIAGMHTMLTRTVITPIALMSATVATSAFRIADPPSGLRLDFALTQRLTPDTTNITSTFDQVYAITNNGTVAVDIVFHVAWDPDLYWLNGEWVDDVVGTGAGLCGVWAHDPGQPTWSVALGNGNMSTVPLANYYGGKNLLMPTGGPPAFEPLRGQLQPLWNNRGMPTTWRNYVVGAGYNAAGDSGTVSEDVVMGTEYRFSIAPNSSETIHVRRYYGTLTIPCFGSNNAVCGNNVVETGEPCDGTDTATCNGATCMPNTCGDGYANAAAGEDCDDAGDTVTCNANCKAPMCGDGHPNAAAGEACDEGGDTMACNATCTLAACGDGYLNTAAEDCETGELCDIATCTHAFTVGGGCAGCGAGDGAGAFGLFASIFILRRRRRA